MQHFCVFNLIKDCSHPDCYFSCLRCAHTFTALLLHHFYYYFSHLYHFYTCVYYIHMYIQTHIRLHSCFLFIPSRYYFIHQPSHKKYTPTIYPHYRKFTLSHFSFPYGSATIYFDWPQTLLVASTPDFDSIRFHSIRSPRMIKWKGASGAMQTVRTISFYFTCTLCLSFYLSYLRFFMGLPPTAFVTLLFLWYCCCRCCWDLLLFSSTSVCVCMCVHAGFGM